jgi:hypothetical protein
MALFCRCRFRPQELAAHSEECFKMPLKKGFLLSPYLESNFIGEDAVAMVAPSLPSLISPVCSRGGESPYKWSHTSPLTCGLFGKYLHLLWHITRTSNYKTTYLSTEALTAWEHDCHVSKKRRGRERFVPSQRVSPLQMTSLHTFSFRLSLASFSLGSLYLSAL